MKLFALHLGLFFFSLFTCGEVSNPYSGRTVDGLRPTYGQVDDDHYYSKEPEAIVTLQNVVLYEDYILVVEQLAGIHVISNEDPTNPVAVAFWVLPGVTNFTIADDVLFMPLGNDIVAIDILDINNLTIISIVENAIESFTNSRSPSAEGPFECVHPDSGMVIGWYADELIDPNCWR